MQVCNITQFDWRGAILVDKEVTYVNVSCFEGPHGIQRRTGAEKTVAGRWAPAGNILLLDLTY